jgi:hypothetical protein
MEYIKISENALFSEKYYFTLNGFAKFGKMDQTLDPANTDP